MKEGQRNYFFEPFRADPSRKKRSGHPPLELEKLSGDGK